MLDFSRFCPKRIAYYTQYHHQRLPLHLAVLLNFLVNLWLSIVFGIDSTGEPRCVNRSAFSIAVTFLIINFATCLVELARGKVPHSIRGKIHFYPNAAYAHNISGTVYAKSTWTLEIGTCLYMLLNTTPPLYFHKHLRAHTEHRRFCNSDYHRHVLLFYTLALVIPATLWLWNNWRYEHRCRTYL